MTKSTDHLETLAQDALRALEVAATPADLESWRVQFLGRKGTIPQFLRGLKDLPLAERKQVGETGNRLRQQLEAAYQEKQKQLSIDTSSPGYSYSAQGPAKGGGQLNTAPGHLHPLTSTIRHLRSIFTALGFTIVEGPDIEEARYNFDYLNIAFEHPARAETDTFYLQNHPDLVLRTHVSPLQIRGVLENNLKAPFQIMYYGPSFRAEKEDPTHGALFQQYEFMVVSEKVNLADLKSIIETVYSTYFGSSIKARFRPGYFPFVEPGLEIDISCVFCERGCRVCKHTKWIELAGAGMVHPNVLKNINVDPVKYQGIALGGGLDRLAMIKHGIPDLRLLYSGNIRFLKQFS